MNILRDFIATSVQVAILISVVTIIHEMGHFICASLLKRKVYEFSIGIGPIIFRKGIFKLKLFPFSGYIQLEINFDNKDITYLKESILIFIAGYILNIIMAIISYPISESISFYIIIFIIADCIVTKKSDGKMIIRMVREILVQKRSK